MATLLYHITHGKNLDSIVREGGLWSTREMAQRKLTCATIANEEIQDRRARTRVTCGPGGTLHEYVPLYFGPRSPMLYVINRRQLPQHEDGQIPILHLVTSVEAVVRAGLSFVFTDGHAIMMLTEFFEDPKDLKHVDLLMMRAKMWNDTPTDRDRPRRRQAEFLIHRFMPWTVVEEIGVLSSKIKKRVEEVLAQTPHRPPVVVRPTWYYDESKR